MGIVSLGAALAARHIYIQSLPPELVPDCIPPLEYLVRTFPVTDILYPRFSSWMRISHKTAERTLTHSKGK